jgi:hypothetical protein
MLAPYQTERMKKFTSMNVEINDRKESEKGRMLIQNKNALVPKKAVLRKEEGATVAASPTFSAAKQCVLVS